MFRSSFSLIFIFILVGISACDGGDGIVPGQTYSVAYDGNGHTDGTVPVDPTSYTQGQSVTVLGNSGGLILSGFAFNGWNTQVNGSGVTYTQGQNFTMDTADVTLYAIWTENPTYTVTYDGNGSTAGTVPVDTSNYEEGQAVVVFENTGGLSLSGYTFTGWNTQADGGGTPYNQTDTFTMGTENITLYAMWEVMASCGNGTIEATEACDDGNVSACGSCNASCTAVQSAPATGVITAIPGVDIADDETFSVSDGFSTTNFEFDKDGIVTRFYYPVVISDAMITSGVRNSIRDAINNTSPSTELAITASNGIGATIDLTNDFSTSLGNQAITETVSNTGFIISGMSGGLGGDCPTNTGCTANADCESGVCTNAACQ